MPATLIIEKAENGFVIIDPQTGKTWVATAWYDITDVCKKFFIPED